MNIQVISDIGDDVYATVSTEEDAIRIDNAMDILLRGDASRIRTNPSDPAISKFAKTHGFDKIEEVEKLLHNVSIAVSGQDNKFVLSDKIVPFIRYFFGDFKSYYNDGDLNFFTTLAALTTKERQTLVNGFRTLSKNNAFGKVSSAHNSTANLQTLYIFLKLLPKDRHLGMSRLFGSLNSENTLHGFFNEYDHYSKYQSLPITIEVLNAAVDKFLNFEITLPFFVDSDLASVIKDNQRNPNTTGKEPYTDILGVEISRKDFESSVESFRTFFANAKSFNDRPKKAIDDIIYYVGYTSPHTFRKENPFPIRYLIHQKEVFYSASLLCYILANSGDMYERLKETNVSASNCIKRILEAKTPSIESSEIFDLFCRENFKPNSLDFFKRGFMLYAMYYDLRARPEPQKVTQTLFDRLLFEAYDANLDFLNDFYNLIFVEKIDLFNKPISNVVDFKIIKYLSSHLPVHSLDRIYQSGRIPRDGDMRFAFQERVDYENSWREIYRERIDKIRDAAIQDVFQGKSPKSVRDSVLLEYKRDINDHLIGLRDTLISEDSSGSIFNVDAALNFVNDLIAIDQTMMSVLESIHGSPESLKLWSDRKLVQNNDLWRYLNVYSPNQSGVRRALSYLFDYFQDESETKSSNQSLRIGEFSLTRLSKYNPLILAVGLKEVSNCCMIYGSAGFSCCLDAFSSDDSQVYVLYDHDLEIFCGSTYAFPGDSMGIHDVQGVGEYYYTNNTYTCDQIELSFDASTKSSEYKSEVADNFIDMFYEFAINFDEDVVDTVIINLSDAGGLPSDYNWENENKIVPSEKATLLDDSCTYLALTAKLISIQSNDTYQDISSTSPKILYICHPERTSGTYCDIAYQNLYYCDGCDEYTAEELSYTGYESLCESCSRQCSECSEVKPKDEIYGLADLCEDCGKYCSGCNDFLAHQDFGDDPSEELCDECYEEEDDDSEY
jgi:hypothetical protein